jgi:predicted phage tail protein
MLRNVWLHGRLADEFGPVFRFDVETAGDAIRALHCNFPTFLVSAQEGSFEIVRGDIEDDSMRLELDQVNEFRLGKADLHIIPHITGSKSQNAGGTLKVILGVALVGTALFMSGGTLGAGLMSTGILSGLTYGNVAMVGVALAVAGVATLLSPKQQDPYNQASFTLSGPGNSYAQGNPVPLVYGEVIVGSQLVSGSLDIEQIPVNWDPTNGNTSIDTFDPETGQGVVSGGPTSYTQPSGYT